MPVRPGAGAPKNEKAEKPKEKATPKEGVVKKSPLVEKAKKFLDTVDPELRNNIFEEQERQVVGDNQEKTNVAFFQFSPADTEEVDNDYNVAAIKEILFAQHTVMDKVPTGNSLMVEVLPPAQDGDAHTLCIYEVSVN